MKKSDDKKEKRIKKIEYSRVYYEKNKYDICKKRVNQYLENSIRNVESFWKNKLRMLSWQKLKMRPLFPN